MEEDAIVGHENSIQNFGRGTSLEQATVETRCRGEDTMEVDLRKNSV
jgi:hypothetical protein